MFKPFTILLTIAPNKLYDSWMVYDKNEHLLRSLDSDKAYNITIEVFNENGISKTSRVNEVK